jgi:8-amino-7-oxononanoate synthase
LSDELVHASIIDGIRLSRADYLRFRHNDLAHLEERLEQVSKNTARNYQDIFVAVESVYSMDGDEAPLEQLAELCERYHAKLVVDEAHATGVFGKNGAGMVSEYGLEQKVFARVHTFGKAMGCHGAVVAGPAGLRDYLVNFSRPFIYSTALPLHSLCAIRMSFKLVPERKEAIEKLHALITIFNKRMSELSGLNRIISRSAIHCILVPGNEQVKALAANIQKRGFDVRPILHPTVPKGKERIRICLHSFNTAEEIMGLVESLIG